VIAATVVLHAASTQANCTMPAAVNIAFSVSATAPAN